MIYDTGGESKTDCVMIIIIKDVDKTQNLSGNSLFILALENLVTSSKIRVKKKCILISNVLALEVNKLIRSKSPLLK